MLIEEYLKKITIRAVVAARDYGTGRVVEGLLISLLKQR